MQLESRMKEEAVAVGKENGMAENIVLIGMMPKDAK